MSVEKGFRRLLYLLCVMVCICAGAAQVLPDERGTYFIEFEDADLPEGLSWSGSQVGLDTLRRMRGRQSLRWEWNGGASLTFEVPVACHPERDIREDGFPMKSCFKVWIYSDRPRPEIQLRIVFGDAQGEPCSFPFYLDFTGWRTAWVSYSRDMEGAPDRDLSYVRFEAPGEGSGVFWIDDLSPALLIDERHQDADRQVPFVNRPQQHLQGKPHEPNILVDQQVDPIAGHTTLSDEERLAFRQLEARLLESYPPQPAPLDELRSAFETFGIVREQGMLRGAPILHLASQAHRPGLPRRFFGELGAMQGKCDFRAYTDLMLQMAQAYRAEPLDELRRMFLLMTEHLLDQGYQAGSTQGTMHHFGYSSRGWPPAVFLMRSELAEAGLLEPVSEALVWYFNLKKHRLPPQPVLGDMDFLNTTLFSEVLVLATLPDGAMKAALLDAMRINMSAVLEMPSPGRIGGIKTDGSLFHHGMHYVGYGIPGISGAARLIALLDGTPYEFTPGAYATVKKAFLSAGLWGYPWSGFNAMGRHPLLGDGRTLLPAMRQLAPAMPGSDGADPDLLDALRAMEDDAAPPPQGAWAMNYHGGGIYAHGNYKVLYKAYGSGVRSHETYKTDNRYGAYSSHGTLQVFEYTHRHRSGFEEPGWSWAQPPGATTLLLPLERLEGNDSFYGRPPPQTAPFGGASHLNHKTGLFAFRLDPAGDQPDSIGVRSSVLAADGQLICLGSGLAAHSDVPLVTTLYQRAVEEERPEVQRGIDWLVDPYGTGYWIGNGAGFSERTGVQVSRHNKTKARTEGRFATAWISHGTEVSEGGYEYVMIPGADARIMKRFSNDRNYRVERRNSSTHAIHLPARNLWSLVNFDPLDEPVGPFVSVDGPSLVLYEEPESGAVQLSVTDPRLHLTDDRTAPPVDVVILLKGRYESVGLQPGISVSQEGTSSRITMSCAEGEATVCRLRRHE